MKHKLFGMLFFFIPLYSYKEHTDAQVWSQSYAFVYSGNEMKQNTSFTQKIIEKKGTQPFTQLIVSWNAQRPSAGVLSFYVQVRDAKTKEWYNYHKVAEWGKGLQKSFFSRTKGSVFCYARLEVSNNRKADAFRIKVKAQKGCKNISTVKAVFTSLSDFTKFKSEPYAQRGSGLKTFKLSGIPKTSQMLVDHPRADAICSPTSLSMVVGTLKKQKKDPLYFANHVYDSGLDAFGNWMFNTAHAYEYACQKVLFYPTRLSSFTSLYNLLQQRIPVVVSVRGPIKGAPRPYEQGHLLLVIGWDNEKKQVLCHDPAFDTTEQVATGYPLHDFIVAWERSRRLTYKPHVLF